MAPIIRARLGVFAGIFAALSHSSDTSAHDGLADDGYLITPYA